MTKRFLYYIGILVLLGAAECLLTPLLASMQESGALALYPLYYLAKLFALAAPFLMLGCAFEAFTAFYSFHTFWLYFFPYLLISLATRVPMALSVVESGSFTSFGIAFLGYAVTALLQALLFLAAALLCYFIFFFKRESLVTHEVFFTKESADGKAAVLCAALMEGYLAVTEIMGIVEDAAARLWIIDGLDILNYLFALLFVGLEGFACYVFARFGGLLTHVQEAE